MLGVPLELKRSNGLGARADLMRIRSYSRIGGAITLGTLILAGAAAAFTWQSMDRARSSASRQIAVKDLLLGFSRGPDGGLHTTTLDLATAPRRPAGVDDGEGA